MYSSERMRRGVQRMSIINPVTRALPRRRSTGCRSYSVSTINTEPSPAGIARLSNRRLVSIHGSDAPRFLQGLTTNNVRPQQSSGWFSAFLTAQGRVLYDVFIYPVGWSKSYQTWLSGGRNPEGTEEPAYMIEVDGVEIDGLVTHLKRHKLRSRLAIRPVDPEDWTVWSVWKKDEKWTPYTASFEGLSAPDVGRNETASVQPGSVAKPDAEDPIVLTDGRAPGLGQRYLVPSGSSLRNLVSSISDLEEVPLSSYTLRRMLRGVGEGSAEIARGTALPLESNIDYMGGLDFRKGCYVGQELTIRTHHTGVVRKRILPVALYEPGGTPPQQLIYRPDMDLPLPSKGADIVKAGEGRKRSVGRWIGGVGNVGLALCRLAAMTGQSITADGGDWSPSQEFEIQTGEDGAEAASVVRVKAFVPDWHQGKERAKGPLQAVE